MSKEVPASINTKNIFNRKKLILINGTMGVGKSAVCRELAAQLPHNVFLDGDWCWMAHPFVVTAETKRMVMENHAFLLNQFLHCSEYENVIFCWVMDQQTIIEALLNRLNLESVEVKTFTLVCSETALRVRLGHDIEAGLRTADIIDRSLARRERYRTVHSVKIDVSSISARDTAGLIAKHLNGANEN